MVQKPKEFMFLKKKIMNKVTNTTMFEKYIESINNPFIKETIKLYDRKDREKRGLFVIEGRKELSLALKYNVQMEHLFYCLEIIDEEGKKLLSSIPSLPKTKVSTKVFEKIAYRGTTEGLLGIAIQPCRKLDDISTQKSFVIILEKMEKPGNIGAILRTANAAGADAVIVCDEISDIYNPNVVRTSLGGLFATPTVQSTTDQTIAWLKKNSFSIIASTPSASYLYNQIPLQENIAVAIGSEKDGLSEPWLREAHYKVLIPMVGEVDSLNASVSAGILIYQYSKKILHN